ncbi:MAG: hypothetical protein HFF26_01790 [Oscillospiraceae bacterium]|nr:hypothetical protein [Oscillospiraceae bacterium]
MSGTLKLGDALTPDHQRCAALARPFIQGLERSADCFYAMVLNGRYLQAVLGRSGLREWSDYAKWSVEGAFEHVRRTEFPDCYSRLSCNYFYDNLPSCKALFDYDWGEASEEERAAIHLYEVELEDEHPQRRDMRIYDQAYDAMCQGQDVDAVLACARRYFAGESSPSPVWELLSEKPAQAVKDITDYLTNQTHF